jgi:hypothetical protein
MILSETPPAREAFRRVRMAVLPAGRFLEMKRGLFFKASYLWRL